MIIISDKHDCCGCTACVSICGHNALEMVCDEEGFLYPKSNLDRCTNCGLCEKVCPIIGCDANKADSKNEPLQVFGAYLQDNHIRVKSSSGGAFTPIAELIINRGGAVYGAEYDENLRVVHKSETTKEGVVRMRGSKYVQSDLRDIYRQVKTDLIKGREVLFTGLPCQVEGLKKYLIRTYDNLLTIDILCHGVPSPKIYDDYINYIRKNSILPLRGINMKDKTFGWGYQNLRLFFSGGVSEFNSPISNLWNIIFYNHLVNRPSCYQCRFKNLNRPSDISIGDFWGIEKSHPEINSTNGVSLILINTEKGIQIWKEIKECFCFVKSNLSECKQPVLHSCYKEPAERESFWRDYLDKGFSKSVIKPNSISHIDSFMRNVRLLRDYLLGAGKMTLF